MIIPAQRSRQVGVALKHLPRDSQMQHFFNVDNVPWQRVINAMGMISHRYIHTYIYLYIYILSFFHSGWVLINHLSLPASQGQQHIRPKSSKKRALRSLLMSWGIIMLISLVMAGFPRCCPARRWITMMMMMTRKRKRKRKRDEDETIYTLHQDID